jgi:hypothetical protein
MQLPLLLRQAIDGLIAELDELGEKTSFGELAQQALFISVRQEPEALAAALREYRRARSSALPERLLKVVPIRRRAGRQREKRAS